MSVRTGAAVRWGLGALLAAALLAPVAAQAFYGKGAQIVSADFERQEQGDDASTFAAISADGRYVAIQTRARNFFADDDPDPPGSYRAGGVFRFDMATKTLAKVADGDLFDEATNGFQRLGAANPSISANGRFVAFSTAQRLTPADANSRIDVYVRDMNVPIGGAGAYDLVSARDGGDVAATYGPPAFPFPGSEPGSILTRGVAISADGQRVVFRTEAPSDLPSADAPSVPAGQLLVRDRVAGTTTLVTARRDDGANQMTAEPAGGAFGAAISADGTAVAWTGSNAAVQTRMLGGENTDAGLAYYLWRRIGSGTAPAQALTRRVTGLADPDDPACPPGAVTFFDRTSSGPCYGPLADQDGLLSNITGLTPALSADGNRVAFLTGSGPRGLASSNSGLDLYLTSMAAGLTRKQATVELTRDTIGTDPATSPPVSSVSMSSSGRYLAIASQRTRFALPILQLLGEPRAVPGPREIYVVDLESMTLDRVTRTYWGGSVEADALNGATISADGSRVAFASFSAGLFFGDANQASDAFVAERQAEAGDGSVPVPPGTGLPDGTVEEESGPRIGVRARALRGGLVELTVSVPAAGGVTAVAKGAAGEPRRQRTLSRATARARGTARTQVKLTLRPVERYRGELRRRGAIQARARVAYVPARGGRRATTTRRVVFKQGSVHPGRGGRR